MADNLSQNYKSEIRKQAVQQAAKWSIAAIAGLVVIAATGWWFYLKPQIAQGLGGVPVGAVLAFDRSAGCPQGWSTFEDAAGRSIVGVGEGIGLTARSYRSEGGREKYTLEVDDLPQHVHKFWENYVGDDNYNDSYEIKYHLAQGSDIRSELLKREDVTILEEEMIPSDIDNMPPFIALYFCKKDGP